MKMDKRNHESFCLGPPSLNHKESHSLATIKQRESRPRYKQSMKSKSSAFPHLVPSSESQA